MVAVDVAVVLEAVINDGSSTVVLLLLSVISVITVVLKAMTLLGLLLDSTAVLIDVKVVPTVAVEL